MSYMDESGNVHMLAASGAYGDMPPSMYLKKIEQTDIYEPENQLEDFMRAELADFKPDAPLFADEAPRSTNDEGYGTHSNRFLNMRHHGTPGYEGDPYLPDGTFLDFIGGGTDADPRGTTDEPNMREHVKQQYARASLVRKSPDSDWSVPESGITPAKMISNIKSGMYKFKNSFRNFEESMDSWHNGDHISRNGKGLNNAAQYTMDGTIIDLTDAEQGNRSDAVTRLSNDPSIAFRHSTPDHIFKVSKYGLVRAMGGASDPYENRGESHVDHLVSRANESEMVNKHLGDLIVDLQGWREVRQEVVTGALYNDSSVGKNQTRRLNPSDVYKIFMITGTQPATAHEELGTGTVRRYSKKTSDNRKTMSQAEVNHKIARTMQMSNNKSRGNERKDLREQILQTASDQGIYTETSTRRIRDTNVDAVRREGLDTRYVEDSKQTKSYRGITPKEGARIHDLVMNDQGFKFSKGMMVRNRNNKSRHTDTNDHDYDQDQGKFEFGLYTKARRGEPTEHGDARSFMEKGHVNDTNMELGGVDLF